MGSPVINALQLKNGAKLDKRKNFRNSLVQPSQFIPYEDKDEEWTAWNMDWLETQGLKQVEFNFPRYIRNIRLAHGVIDRRDYTNCEENEYGDIFKLTADPNDSALELKFYPIIPNILNLFRGELMQKSTDIQWIAQDDVSYNELLEKKQSEIENILIQQEQQKFMQKLIEQGMDPNDPKVQAQIQQDIKSLPEVQDFYTKTYRTSVEMWATHQYNSDVEKFHFSVLEDRQFLHYLTHDQLYFHFNMKESDYDIEEWEPIMTAAHRSPGERYASNSSWVVHFDKFTLSDVIDKYGYLMGEEDIENLETLFPTNTHLMNLTGQAPDEFYDPNESYDSNMGMPSVQYRQLQQSVDTLMTGTSFIDRVINGKIESPGLDDPTYIRVATMYWKTQRKVGHYTYIDENGELVQDIVSEDAEITIPGIYDYTYIKADTKDNLRFGEHIDWYWINEVWGGTKIGPNSPQGFDKTANVKPIYLGINQKCPGRLKFQFKGDRTTYGAKLPVEGWLGSSRHIWDCSLVNTLAPFQLLHNMSMNQLADIQIGEFGAVLTLDQNILPQNSMGEDWGKSNLAKTYTVMQDFSILPTDMTLANTEQGVATSNMQVLDLSETQRLLTRMQIADYYKQRAYETVGVTPQRLGEVGKRETAAGVSAAQGNSFSQTAKYFATFCDDVMPRVHTMRTNLAQYYNSTNPSERLQYITTADERINFQTNSTKLLAADINVFCTTRIAHENLKNQLKQFAMEDNTTAASFLDRGSILKANSIAEIDKVLAKADAKIKQAQQDQYNQEQAMEDKRIQAEKDKIQNEQQFTERQNLIKAQAQLEAARIAHSDVPQETSVDPSKELDRIQQNAQFASSQDFERSKHYDNMNLQREHNQIQREKIQAERDKASKEFKVASKPSTKR